MINNINSLTKESDLDIVYGMIDFGPERELARTSVKYIYTDVSDIQRSFIRLGFHLHEFNRYEYYRDFGYSTLEEFSDKNLGMDKSAISRCINVFLNFAQYENHVPKMWLDEKYKEFSYSQLCEMLPLKDEERMLVKPDMTIKQIRELKKKRKPDVVATSQPGNYLCSNDFFTKHGVVLQNHIKKCNKRGSMTLEIFDTNGKRIHIFNDCDVLLSGSIGCEHSKVILRLKEE